MSSSSPPIPLMVIYQFCVSCLNRSCLHSHAVVQNSERWRNFSRVTQLTGTRVKMVHSVSTAHSVIYTRFYCKLSMCFVSKILRNPTFQRLFPFPLITWQAKHLFQIVILRLRVKLTFGNDRKHPKPNLTWTTNHSLLFILFLPCSHWWVLKDVWTRKYKES